MKPWTMWTRWIGRGGWTLFVAAGCAFAAPVRVQSCGSFGTAVRSMSLAYSTCSANTTAGNLLIAVHSGGQNDTLSITDSQSQTWSKAVNSTGGVNGQTQISYFANAAGGADTVTANDSKSEDIHIHIYEVSGIATSSPLDATGSATFATVAGMTVSTSAATTQASEYAVAGFTSWNQGAQTFTAAGGFTNEVKTNNTGGGDSMQSADRVLSATGTQSPSETLGTMDAGSGAVATFTAASGGSSNPPHGQLPLAGVGK